MKKISLDKIVSKSANALKRNMPALLSLVAIVGVVSTTVLAVKATPKAKDKIQRDSCINHNGDAKAFTKTEAFKSAWRFYIPTAISGIGTITCILGANILNKKMQSSVASAYLFLDQSYRNYIDAVKSVYGEDADKKIKAEIAQKTYISDGINGYTYSPDDDQSEVSLFFDDISGNYFESTLAAVINAQYHINRNLLMRGYITLNDYYEFLGLDKVKGGDTIGWNCDEIYADGYVWLDFSNSLNVLDDGLRYYHIFAGYEPKLIDEFD